MEIFSVLVVALGLFCGMGQTADLFQGYLIHDADSDTCFKDNSGTPAMVSFTAETFAECTLVKVSDVVAGGFIVEVVADATKQLTVTATDTTAATLTNSGTALKFVGSGGDLSTVATLTDSSNTFKIDVNAASNTGQDCLKGDLVYTDTDNANACDAELFYFQLAACTDTNCKTCVPDPDDCSECEDNAPANAAGTECVACSGTTDCTECTLDDQDAIQCSACSGVKTVTDNACVVPCPAGQTENAGGTCDVLNGYLIFAADPPKCFKNNEGNAEMVTYEAMTTDCTKVKVTGFASLGYIIEDASVADKQITYADSSEGTTPTLTASGTAFKFVLSNAEQSTTAALVDSENPFVIDQKAGANTGEDCVTGTLAYTDTSTGTTCDALLFYFVIGCEDNETPNAAGTACLACSDVTDCATCTANAQDEIQCSTCEGKIVVSNECQACPDGEEPNTAGTECQATTTVENTTAAGGQIIPSTIIMITMVVMVAMQN